MDTTFAEGPRRFEEKVQNRATLMDNIVAGLTRKVPSADQTSEELEFKNEQNKC